MSAAPLAGPRRWRRRDCLQVAVGGLLGALPFVRVQAAAAGVEVAELLKRAMLPAGRGDLASWSQLDTAGVRWATPVPVAAPRAYAGIGALWRQGSVVLLDRGEPLYADGRGRPGPWTVTGLGPREGVVEWRLAMATTGEGGLVVENLAQGGLALQARCEPMGVSSGAKVWVLRLQGRAPLTLHHEWSAGSAGEMHQVTLPYSSRRVAAAQCL